MTDRTQAGYGLNHPPPLGPATRNPCQSSNNLLNDGQGGLGALTSRRRCRATLRFSSSADPMVKRAAQGPPASGLPVHRPCTHPEAEAQEGVHQFEAKPVAVALAYRSSHHSQRQRLRRGRPRPSDDRERVAPSRQRPPADPPAKRQARRARRGAQAYPGDAPRRSAPRDDDRDFGRPGRPGGQTHVAAPAQSAR